MNTIAPKAYTPVICTPSNKINKIKSMKPFYEIKPEDEFIVLQRDHSGANAQNGDVIKVLSANIGHASYNTVVKDKYLPWLLHKDRYERNCYCPLEKCNETIFIDCPLPVKKKVYLAGPMSGVKSFNFPAFDDAREELSKKGFSVVSPADLDRANGFHPDYDKFTEDHKLYAIDRDLEAIKNCDMVVVLPCFEHSIGVRAELSIAAWLGKPIHRYQNGHIGPKIKISSCYL